MKRSFLPLLFLSCFLLVPATACVVESLRFDRLACTPNGECSPNYKCYRVPSVGNLCLNDGGGFEPVLAPEPASEPRPESATEATPEPASEPLTPDSEPQPEAEPAPETSWEE